MGTSIHFRPSGTGKTWNLHAWDGKTTWDIAGTVAGDVFDFAFPASVPDLRTVQFKFRSTNPDGSFEWEGDQFIRYIRLAAPTDIWCFASSSRLLYQPPTPPGVTFAAGDTLTFHVVTAQRFKGGEIYVWDAYHGNPDIHFPEVARDDSSSTSTFSIKMQAWMTQGFNFKLFEPPKDWEAESSNRVWCPSDGKSVWIKSGQVNLRQAPLTLTPVPLEILYSARMAAPPKLNLNDLGENQSFPIDVSSAPSASTSPLFLTASYAVPIFPEAPYSISVRDGSEWSPVSGQQIYRPFPADPRNLAATSRFVLGVDGWVGAFPPVASSTNLVIEPDPAHSSFGSGVSVTLATGGSLPYRTVPAALQADGTWQAVLDVVPQAVASVQFQPVTGEEPKPYPKPRDWISTLRLFTPQSAGGTVFATEGVFGLSSRGKTTFGIPPDNRSDIMKAAFGNAVVDSGVFGSDELPHGATIKGTDVYFVIHAPHSVWTALVLVDEHAAGGPARRLIPMSLTPDLRYWWCKVLKTDAPPGTRYRFALNDGDEVLDPAARAVADSGDFNTSAGDSVAVGKASWAVVLDVDAVYTRAHRQPWQTMGWDALLIYEIHARRFTKLNPGSLLPLQILVDELQPTSRLAQPGYLRELPVTAFELMPVHEFRSDNSWGYNPAFYFAVDSSYGGAMALADFVDAAHQNGKAVMLDVVYNHTSDSPLVKIARDVYRIDNQWGDGVNCGHPIVIELIRQATIYMWRTFNICGFRFDDTKVIIGSAQGGWDFLAAMHSALGKAATAEGRSWPYLCSENDSDGNAYNLAHPGWNVMDGEWAWDEVYRFQDVGYDTKNNTDSAGGLKEQMDAPSFDNRPYYIAVRHSENHDRVAGQSSNDQRIASRPPFGQGLRMSKALGTVPLLSNGVPMLFMGQEVAETRPFSFDDTSISVDPQRPELPKENRIVAAWFHSLMGLRNDPGKGLRGQSNYQVVKIGRRTVAFTCGSDSRLFCVVTWGTPDQQQNSAWLGLPEGIPYKEIFNSSWPVFQVEWEDEHSNGGYDAQIYSGQILKLPFIGGVVLERRDR